jgi:phosphopantetheinyl transferase
MDTVHVTLIRTDIDDAVLAQMIDALSPSEQARAARFRQVGDRRRHVVARTVLKGLLAERLACHVSTIRLVQGAHGKPMLDPAEHGHREAPPICLPSGTAGQRASVALHFNLSHSGDLALIALSPVPAGIDLERDTPADAHALAQAWFTPAEQARLAGGEDDFLTLWTAREAVLKAMGTGLSGIPDFNHYACLRLDLGSALTEPGTQAIPQALSRGYRAALAVSGAARPLKLISTDVTRFAPRVTLDALAPASRDALCLHP